VDAAARSLKVATRVRIPLGLLSFTLVEVGRGAKEVVDLSAQQIADDTVLMKKLTDNMAVLEGAGVLRFGFGHPGGRHPIEVTNALTALAGLGAARGGTPLTQSRRGSWSGWSALAQVLGPVLTRSPTPYSAKHEPTQRSWPTPRSMSANSSCGSIGRCLTCRLRSSACVTSASCPGCRNCLTR
jgi:hypothetical protein